MKKIVISLLTLLIIVMSGCSSTVQIGSVENNSKHEFSASYYQLNGTKIKQVKVDEGEPLNVSMNITTKKGSIDVFIYKDSDNYEYKGNNMSDHSSEVTLSAPGTYTIKVVAKDHRGSYQFIW